MLTVRAKILSGVAVSALLLGTAGLMTTQSANALVVSDPGAYSRMAQQIKNLKSQLDAIKRNVNAVRNVKSKLEGHLNIGKEMISDIQDVRDQAEQVTSTVMEIPNTAMGIKRDVEGTYQDAKDTVEDVKDFDPGSVEDISDYLDQIYANDNLTVAGLNADQRREYQRRAVKSSLEQSQATIGSMDENMQTISELAREIDEAENQKEATDLTNRLLAEILQMQQKSVMLLAQQVRAENVARYSGAKKKLKTGEEKGKTDNRSPMERAMDEGDLGGVENVQEDIPDDRECIGYFGSVPDHCKE